MMQHVSGLLEKKLKHPRFQEAINFGLLKKTVETFFSEKGLTISVLDFDHKSGVLRIETQHASASREVLGLHEELNETLNEARLQKVKRMRISAKSTILES